VLLSPVVDADGRVADLYPPPKRLAVLLHISQEALESYVMRTLPDLEIEPLEVHLFICQECRDRLMTVLSAMEKLPQI
jgi:hypothetical protein